MTYQEIINAIESLPISDRDNILELIRKQQIPSNRQYVDEQQRAEILANEGDLQSVETDTTTQACYKEVDPTTQDENEIHTFDRDGNPFTYSIRDLFWSQEAYYYTKKQEKSFNLHLTELVSKYGGEYVVFENGRVIDRDANEDILLDRISETSFFNDRDGIFCAFVPNRLEINV